MHLAVFAAAIVLAVPAPAADHASALSAPLHPMSGPAHAERVEWVATIPPEDTFNEFLPEERSLGECISALPKPGCGSEARGGWRQGLILVTILGALSFIAWRVVRGARLSRTPDDTTVPDDRGDDHAP